LTYRGSPVTCDGSMFTAIRDVVVNETPARTIAEGHCYLADTERREFVVDFSEILKALRAALSLR
jgi:hypothetical protein